MTSGRRSHTALGVVSRVEEVTDGFDVGISSNVTWLMTAFFVGALARLRRLGPTA